MTTQDPDGRYAVFVKDDAGPSAVWVRFKERYRYVANARRSIAAEYGGGIPEGAMGIGFADSIVPFETVPFVRTEADLAGDGNVFAVMSRAIHALRRDGKWRDADELYGRVTQAEDYDAALRVILDYVNNADDDDFDDGPALTGPASR